MCAQLKVHEMFAWLLLSGDDDGDGIVSGKEETETVDLNQTAPGFFKGRVFAYEFAKFIVSFHPRLIKKLT